ncbi:MAG: amidohydrolase [Chitinophagaceae bacterium]|nr:amidohydrolase [Chitinophagaceae bacterium]
MKQKKIFILLLLLISFSIATMAQTKKENTKLPPPIIDGHFHTFKIRPGGKMDYLNVYSPKSQAEYEKQLVAALNKYNIYAIASGDDSVLQSMKQKEPKRILPSKLIWSPKAVDMAQLRQEIKDKKWDAIGELLSQYATLPANDPSLDPLYSLAEEMDIPVGIHMGPGPMGAAYIPMFKGYRMSLTHPFYLEDVLIKHPKLRLYVMHAGYPMIDEMLGMLYDFPQLYVGIAAIDWIFPNRKEFYRYLKTLVDAGYEKRILFGSDEMEWPQGIGMAIKNVQEAPFLTESEKRDILFNNAVRFFKLNPADFRNN